MIDKDENLVYDSKYEELFEYVNSMVTLLKLQNKFFKLQIIQIRRDSLLPIGDGATPVGFFVMLKNKENRAEFVVKIKDGQDSLIIFKIPIHLNIKKQLKKVQLLKYKNMLTSLNMNILNSEYDEQFHSIRCSFKKEHDVKIVKDIVSIFNYIIS